MTTFLDVLNRLWPNGDRKVAGLRAGIAAAAPAVFKKYGLDSALIVAHAMAQFSHECGGGLEMVENINYSAERACEVWPSRFSSAGDCYAKCDSFDGDPQFHVKLIDHVYGGRMGNKPYPSHDGSTYIGRGLSQVTGREGYEKLAAKTGLDLIGNPGLISAPATALECGVADFVLCGCLPYAKADDIDKVTLKLNGGHIGQAEREAWLRNWKAALVGVDIFAGASMAPPLQPSPTPVPAPVPAPKVKPKHVGIAAMIVAIGAAVANFWAAHHVAIEIGGGVLVIGLVAWLVLRKRT